MIYVEGTDRCLRLSGQGKAIEHRQAPSSSGVNAERRLLVHSSEENRLSSDVVTVI